MHDQIKPEPALNKMLLNEMIDILAVQETKESPKHPGRKFDDYIWINKPNPTLNASKKAHRGLAFCIRKRIAYLCRGISDKRINGNANTQWISRHVTINT